MRTLAKIFLSVSFGAHAAAQLSEPEFGRIFKIMQPLGTSTPKEITDIEDAIKKNDFTTAQRLSNIAIDRTDAAGESPQFNQWVRSLAYTYRATAALALTGDWGQVLPDIKKCADIGNLKCIRLLIEGFIESKAGKSTLGGYRPTEYDWIHYFTLGADLVDQYALSELNGNSVPVKFPADQKLYWKLMLLAETGAGDSRRRELSNLLKTEGETKMAGVLQKYGLAGGPFAATSSVAGRDLAATIFSDYNLRLKLVKSLGFHAPREKVSDELALTVRENFLFLSTLMSRIGMADMYLLVPRESPDRGQNMRFLNRNIVAAEIHAGDSIWVSCGPLSHTASVFRIDREKDSLMLSDGSYEFWQPSHNYCISSLSFKAYKYGFSLPEVKLSEVVPMIDAVGSLRTAEFAGSFENISEQVLAGSLRQSPSSTSCKSNGASQDGLVGASVEQLIQADLLVFFNFFQVKTESKAGGGTVVYFKPSTSQYYGNVGLIAAGDANACVRSMSLTVRRSFIEEQSTALFGRDLAKSFLTEALSGSSKKTVERLIDRIRGRPMRNPPPASEIVAPEVEAAIQVFAGERTKAELTLQPERLRMENITAMNGAELLRLSVW